MLEAIQTYFFERAKRQRLSDSSRRSPQFRLDRKNHFGILLDAGNHDDRTDALAFAEALRKDGNQVKIIGYLVGRAEGLSLPFDLFTNRELAKITQIPNSPEVNAFLDVKFDVLINMSIHYNHKPLDYISSLSKATFRIGPWYHHERHNPYDLCIDAGSSATLKDWINELMHTLRKIY